MASKDSIKYALGKFAEAELAHLPNHFVSNVKSKLDVTSLTKASF